jgi:hypothetical protein
MQTTPINPPVSLGDLRVEVVLCQLYHGRHSLAVEYGVGLLLLPVVVGGLCLWGGRLNCKGSSKRRQRQEGVEYGAHRGGGGGGGLPSGGSGARVTILLLYYKAPVRWVTVVSRQSALERWRRVTSGVDGVDGVDGVRGVVAARGQIPKRRACQRDRDARVTGIISAALGRRNRIANR